MYFVHPQTKIKPRSLKLILSSFFGTAEVKDLLVRLDRYFPNKQIIFTDMGRSAFRAILEKLNLRGAKILFPAYLCDVFYPVLKDYNIQPVFLDIGLDTFNARIEEIESKFTPDAKAVVVCHTYGLMQDIEQIRFRVPEGTLVIEDCAHAFGGKLAGKYAGNFGDVSFFSIYKFLPTCRGGMLVCPNDWELHFPKTGFSFRDFLSFLNSVSAFAFLFKIFGQDLAPRLVRKEKGPGPARINPISLNFFCNFFEDFEKNLDRRIKLALFFQEELKKLGFEVQAAENNVFCYLSALVPAGLALKRDEIVKRLRGSKIFATRSWYAPIILNPEAQKEYRIDLKEFPNTVEAARRIINFPLQNHYTEEDIRKMVVAIKKALANL